MSNRPAPKMMTWIILDCSTAGKTYSSPLTPVRTDTIISGNFLSIRSTNKSASIYTYWGLHRPGIGDSRWWACWLRSWSRCSPSNTARRCRTSCPHSWSTPAAGWAWSTSTPGTLRRMISAHGALLRGGCRWLQGPIDRSTALWYWANRHTSPLLIFL